MSTVIFRFTAKLHSSNNFSYPLERLKDVLLPQQYEIVYIIGILFSKMLCGNIRLCQTFDVIIMINPISCQSQGSGSLLTFMQQVR